MHRIRVKLQITMILTLLFIGCTSSDRSTTTYRTTRRVRHHRSNGSSGGGGSEAEFKKNWDLVNSQEWRCGTPKPRLVQLNEALTGEPSIQPYMHWVVKSALLFRCESMLGCCSDHTKTCSQSTQETVTITFKAIDARTNTVSYPELQFRNHTRCSCQTPTT